MNAVTTPVPLLLFIVTAILPYQTYAALASNVPTESGAIVNNTWLSYVKGWPLETQFVLEASPRYFVLGVIPSSDVSLKSWLLQVGAGTQESSE